MAEGALSGCLWAFVLAMALGASMVTGWLRGPSLAVGAVMALLGGAGLGWLAGDRRRKTEALLQTRPGERRFPTLLRPFTVPMSVYTRDGVTRIWRVHGVTPNGRAATAEVMVEVPTGVSLVAWGTDRPRPPAARDTSPVVDPVVPGCLVASHRPEVVSGVLRHAATELAEAVPDDGHVAVYPFGLWWRVVGPVDAERLVDAERRLVLLAEALRRGSP